MVRGEGMLTCPKCQAGVPEGMRFCLQCGASFAPRPSAAVALAEDDAPFRPAPVAAPPRPPRTALSTIDLRIAPTPVMSPRAAANHRRPSLGDDLVEIDEELLKKAFQRPLPHPGTVACRFCKGPLDLNGDYCEHCGAPVAEAAPPGALPSKPQPEAPVPPPSKLAEAAPPANPPGAGIPAPQMDIELTPTVPSVPPGAPAEERPSGFMGRLKGLFKKS